LSRVPDTCSRQTPHERRHQKEAKKTDAAGAYAKEALPTLHKHLETAQSLTSTATTGKR
jgi:hypothetical protein